MVEVFADSGLRLVQMPIEAVFIKFNCFTQFGQSYSVTQI
jgi:hypothetical protein